MNETKSDCVSINAVPKATRPVALEIVLSACLIVFCAMVGPLITGLKLFPVGDNDIIEFIYSSNATFSFSKSLILSSLVGGIIDALLLFILLFLVRPSGIKPDIGKNGKHLLPLAILYLFGYLAYLVIALLVSVFKVSPEVSIGMGGLISNIYLVLVYKLYMENRTYSNALFWEIFRFAIVGLVAAVFDFLTCYLVQFVAFKGNEAVYVTGIATGCGFIIGVTINYLMSTYMVYKASKSGFSKSFKGIASFLVLSIIGLLIGIGIQYVLYDFLNVSKGVTFLSYPVDFIIRTLVVMVYNYISRKIFIYK
ncbi:MAG: GtrA family protein [Bacilli bacterium]|jgi:putative flippase GtrA